MQILMTALQPGGGIRTFFRYIYGQPAFDGFTFTLLAPDSGLEEYISSYLPPGRIRLVKAKEGHLDFIIQARTLIKNGGFDLIHSHGFSAGLLTEIAKTGIKIPHIMTAHDVFRPEQFIGWKQLVKKRVMSYIFTRMTAIHTVTNDARLNFLSYFPSVDEAKVKGILHGVDSEYFKNGAKRNIKEELGLSEDTLLLGFFGRFMGQKGFRILVDAVKKIKNHDSINPMPHIVTFGWGGYIREDYSYLNSLGLGDYFHQLEQTDDMPSALKGVDLVVMPSRWEACGLLAMEALSAGVPIVGTDCIGLREVLEKSPATMALTGSSDSLAEAIVDELKQINQRKKQFLEYQNEAVDFFNIKRPSEELSDLYDIVKLSGL
ncbi:glycosyltransferase family 4 protein [Marinobacter mobilis]|uniref:Glycosyltransferase involved in cell wall bisynthesis n=1 Tax=Marinobacter mobilis TaxID=488533 RepID=A0A1H2UX29_9GAMM|nr:glycosyltransferase family 4 protein [Marinobacter mobilis]SDW60174.1 Glycosyltransferase involved in cell wall bisynthesis [Marinobacter mobilis]